MSSIPRSALHRDVSPCGRHSSPPPLPPIRWSAPGGPGPPDARPAGGPADVRAAAAPRRSRPPRFKRQNRRLRDPRGARHQSSSTPPNTYLYLVLGNGRALRYGHRRRPRRLYLGRRGRPSPARPSGRTGTPPPEMLERQPYLPRFMAGGPGNPPRRAPPCISAATVLPHPRPPTRPKPSAGRVLLGLHPHGPTRDVMDLYGPGQCRHQGRGCCRSSAMPTCGRTRAR